jgi:hypothetical protein
MPNLMGLANAVHAKIYLSIMMVFFAAFGKFQPVFHAEGQCFAA